MGKFHFFQGNTTKYMGRDTVCKSFDQVLVALKSLRYKI